METFSVPMSWDTANECHPKIKQLKLPAQPKKCQFLWGSWSQMCRAILVIISITGWARGWSLGWDGHPRLLPGWADTLQLIVTLVLCWEPLLCLLFAQMPGTVSADTVLFLFVDRSPFHLIPWLTYIDFSSLWWCKGCSEQQQHIHTDLLSAVLWEGFLHCI